MAYLHKRVNCFCFVGSLRGGGRIVFASSFDEIVVVWIGIDWFCLCPVEVFVCDMFCLSMG